MAEFDAREVTESQIPALQLLAAMGYSILPQEDVERRRGRLRHVLLEDVLAERILANNSFTRRGVEHRFKDGDAEEAIRKLKPDPTRLRGLVGTNQEIYDTLVLGTTIEKTIDGDRKSQHMHYVDWQHPERNAFHATAEFRVERTGSIETKRCDIVLFVNGIPFVVIECKAPEYGAEPAISQIIGYQGAENIPHLFHYTQLVAAICRREARYATVGTSGKFWSAWRDEEDQDSDIAELINAAPDAEAIRAIFSGVFREHQGFFEEKAAFDRAVTEQDRMLYALCRPERLLELVRTFTVFEGGQRKIARHQQFFGIRQTMRRIHERDAEGRRRGGVIWHTQGSGKSLTMVMLGRALAFDPEVRSPRIVIVTDRTDLDRQIKDTFRSCEMEPHRASTGRDLLAQLEAGNTLITAVVNKFDTALRASDRPQDDEDTFVLVDESHRSHYGTFATKMHRLLPRACYIGFTGTPLLKREKSTLARFGGLIHKYAIDQAVKDKAVVPLLYEGRFVDERVSGASIDTWFEKLAEGLNERERADLRRKFSRMELLGQTEQAIYAKAMDISEHYRQQWQGTGFKAQLVAPSKAAAIRYKEILDEIGHVTSEVVISPPDDREGNEEVDAPSRDKVRRFWDRMMQRFENLESRYQEAITDAFKNADEPEILIVVSKLLTGFDAPRNTVLYVCRALKEHTLLQAIARVNRLYDEDGREKEFGYIVDYEGLLGELDQALTTYSTFEGYEEEDLLGVVADIREVIRDLARLHGEVWDIFREVRNKKDMEALEEHLADEARRDEFYEALRAFGRCLHTALGSEKTWEIYGDARIAGFKEDWRNFDKLRRSVQSRYQDTVDLREYEPKVRALLDRHVIAEPARVIVELVDLNDPDALKKVLAETTTSSASKADKIASATKKKITERMDEDPSFYKRFSAMLEETIAAYRQKRLSEKDYLNRVLEIAKQMRSRSAGGDLPKAVRSHAHAQAFYRAILGAADLNGVDREAVGTVAKDVADLIESRLIVRFWENELAQKDLLNALDDYFFDEAPQHGVELRSGEIDALTQELLRIARARYHR